MKVNKKALEELCSILYGACHAKGCEQLKKCPKLCGCNRRRPFKLNNETAMCWILAGEISGLISMTNPSKEIIKNIYCKMEAYHSLSAYHMTNGWHSFILEIGLIFARATQVRDVSVYRVFSIQHDIDILKRKICYLKRFPK